MEKEARWLAKLAPHLPLEIPVPLAMGEPGEGYPCHWSVCPWVAGENATVARIRDLREAARDLAAFVRAMQARAKLDATGALRQYCLLLLNTNELIYLD